jgi:hypothetical protein
MAEMDGPVDRAFLVSVADLRDICDALNDEKREYRLTREEEKNVAILFNDGSDDLSASLCSRVPEPTATIWAIVLTYEPIN